LTGDKDAMIAHYAQRLREFGPGPEAVHWSDRETQYTRFAVLAGIRDDLGAVADFGCGLGEMYFYLAARGGFESYTGFDVVPEFVALASERFEGIENATVVEADIAAGGLHKAAFDHVFASGVFNNARDDNWDFLTGSLRAMWGAARRGIAFNAMSSFVDYRDDALWYVEPARVLAFCKTELGAHVTLRHDYVLREGGFPFEFAVYARRRPVLPSLPEGAGG